MKDSGSTLVELQVVSVIVGLLAEATPPKPARMTASCGSSGLHKGGGCHYYLDAESATRLASEEGHDGLAARTWSYDNNRVGAPCLDSAACGT